MELIRLLIFKQRSFGIGNVTFCCKAEGYNLSIQISECSEKLYELTKKVVTDITENYQQEKFYFVFTPEGIETIQTGSNLKGELKTTEGLSPDEKESFLQYILIEKSRVNAE